MSVITSQVLHVRLYIVSLDRHLQPIIDEGVTSSAIYLATNLVQIFILIIIKKIQKNIYKYNSKPTAIFVIDFVRRCKCLY